MEIKKQLIAKNYSKDKTIVPKYIVIHETDNWREKANAQAHYHYWNTNDNANSSVHFVVDDKEIVQLLELNNRAWHVGDNKGYSDITNDNAIGIEICVNRDGNYLIARQKTIELTIFLLKVLQLPISNLVRHYDASGKHCPRTMLDNQELWLDFKEQVKKAL